MNSSKHGIIGEQIVNRKTDVPIPSDEPVFVIRARDPVSIGALEGYIDEAQEQGAPDDFVDEVKMVMKDFNDWQAKNETRMPD